MLLSKQVCFELQPTFLCSIVLDEYLTSSSCNLHKAVKVNMTFSFLTSKSSSGGSPKSACGHSFSGFDKNGGPLSHLSLLRSWGYTESPRDVSAELRVPGRCLHWFGHIPDLRNLICYVCLESTRFIIDVLQSDLGICSKECQGNFQINCGSLQP